MTRLEGIAWSIVAIGAAYALFLIAYAVSRG